MRYRKFIIQNYRGIVGPLEIDVLKKSLHPIIGVNESSKTTILQAILAFDCHNDRLNDNGRHLKDIENLFATAPETPTISAEVDITYDEFTAFLGYVQEDTTVDEAVRAQSSKYRMSPRKRASFPGRLLISRNLHTNKYDLHSTLFPNRELNHEVAT